MRATTFLLAFCLTFTPVLGQARWGGRTYTNRVCNSPYCAMCNSIQRQLTVQRQTYTQPQYVQPITQPVYVPQRATVVESRPETVNAAQANAPDNVIDEALESLRLTPRDTLADYGCGDGRVLIRAVQDYGCSGVGIEIDRDMARKARQKVLAAERAGEIPKGSIAIVTGDVTEFEPSAYDVTAIYAYLYPELLARLADQMESVGRAVTPFHGVDGLDMQTVGNVYVYEGEPEVQFEIVPEEPAPRTDRVAWDLVGGLSKSEETAEWSMTSATVSHTKIDVWMYTDPGCALCRPTEKWLRKQPWARIKKRTGKQVPSWVTGYPTLVWKNACGQWKQIRGWHGEETMLAWMTHENPEIATSRIVAEEGAGGVDMTFSLIASRDLGPL